MKKHVLLVASGAGLAGGEKNLFDIVRYLVRSGEWEPYVAVPAGGRLETELAKLGVPVYRAPLPPWPNLQGFWRLDRIIATHKIAVVHAHGFRAAMYARPAARLAGVPCVYTVHGIHFPHHPLWRRGFSLGLERCLRRWTVRTIFVCRADMDQGLAAGIADAATSAVIYNGVEPPAAVSPERRAAVRRALGIDSQAPLVLNIGRFHYQKGQEYLIEAAAVILRDRPEVRFVLAGDGATLPEAKALARRLGLEGKVLFPGARDDAPDLMAAADVFALSSRWEGLPYVLLEAAGMELSMVSAAVDGVPEIVVDGETGLLAPPGDTQALAQQILRLLDDEDLRARLTRRAKQLVAERFSLEEMSEKISALYRELNQI